MAFTVVLLRRDGARMWIRSFLIDGEHSGEPETACGSEGGRFSTPTRQKQACRGPRFRAVFFVPRVEARDFV